MPRAPPNPDSLGKDHFSLQLYLNSLNSSGAEPEPAQSLSRTGPMNASPKARRAGLACLLLLAPLAGPTQASNITLPPETPAILDKIYSFDLEGAVEAAKRMEQELPNHPLGYLLEAEALWWRIWCTSADFKYGMSDARRRPKLEADRRYFELAAKALDPDLADADLGLGLYNYYVDTLSAIARILRFFVGIPGGSKQEGVRLLEHAMAQGVLTSNVARFYLALNLHRYDQQYEKALTVLSPLVEKYPTNPLFQLARGDLYAKLGRKQQALACYRAASALPLQDAECQAHVRELTRISIAALGLKSESGDH